MAEIPPGEITAAHLYIAVQDLKADVLVIKTQQKIANSVIVPAILSVVIFVAGLIIGTLR